MRIVRFVLGLVLVTLGLLWTLISVAWLIDGWDAAGNWAGFLIVFASLALGLVAVGYGSRLIYRAARRARTAGARPE